MTAEMETGQGRSVVEFYSSYRYKVSCQLSVVITPMRFFLIYFGIGIAVYGGLLVLFRKTHVDRRGLHGLWWGWLLSGELVAFLLGPLLWPLVALLSILWWLGDYWHLQSKRRDAKAKEETLKRPNEYSHLNMDELLIAQKRVLAEPQTKNESKTK